MCTGRNTAATASNDGKSFETRFSAPNTTGNASWSTYRMRLYDALT